MNFVKRSSTQNKTKGVIYDKLPFGIVVHQHDKAERLEWEQMLEASFCNYAFFEQKMQWGFWSEGEFVIDIMELEETLWKWEL